VYEFKSGETPDPIQSHLPTLSPDQTYGAIASYLGNKDDGGSVRKPERLPEALPPRWASYPNLMEIYEEVCFCEGLLLS
jgi:hypothetical protein